MKRRDFLKLAGCGAVALSLPRKTFAAEGASLAGRKPNIILILTDDQGYGDLGRNGNTVIKTPNQDKIYDEGVRFEDFHTSPTCAPTRSSIMTGKHEFKNGITHTILERERMSLKSTTIAQVLKSAGYTTGIFGKWHLGDEDEYQPEKRGFDEVFIHGAGGIGQSYPGTCGDAPGNSYFGPVIKHNGKFEKTEGYCTDVFFSQAVKWIEASKGVKPFFTYITPNAPHSPLDVPDEYEKMYAGKVDEKAAKFFGMITNIDDNVGKMMKKLSEWGIDKDTLLIYVNDNGGTAGCKVFNAGMRGTKGTAFNGGTRSMSLWRWPGTLKPAACDKLTAHLDMFPTFAELAGAKVPDDVVKKLDGFSLVPLLENPQAKWHDERMLFTHVGRWGGMTPGAEPEKYGACSVRWQEYLQVWEKGKWCLYDLKADPSEKNNIADSHKDVVDKLNKAYDVWWQEVLPCLENEKAYKTAPQVNPFREQYWKQYGGPGPNNVPPGAANPPAAVTGKKGKKK
ncbi:MAG: arylsulfatase [Lentisphaerae bacterium RIFOXYA12_FULL_48_11]|nr:MAG: arylsulfatase [Lentisphaerae bacterium RIFOXYA12_FULL_48_11]